MEALIYIIIGMVVCVTLLMVGLVKKQLEDHKYKDTPSYYRTGEIDLFNWGLLALFCGSLWPLAMILAVGYGFVVGLMKALEVVAKRIASGIITINKVSEMDNG